MSKASEQYSRAVSSSHLRMSEHRGDADVLTVAAFADSLGRRLMRVRKEWDKHRAAVELEAGQHRAALERARIEEKKDGGTPGAMRAEAEDESLRTRALIFIEMADELLPLRDALMSYATRQAAFRRLEIDVDHVRSAVGNALDIWLDQRCVGCTGRGINGGYGTPQIICRKCKGAMLRRRALPYETAAEGELGEWLISQMSVKVAAAERKIERGMR